MGRFDMPGFGGDQRINGNNTNNINSISGDVFIAGSNYANIKVMSGDLNIEGENSSFIEAMSGDVKIGNTNNGQIKVMSGDIKVKGGNFGSISNSSGDIKVKGINEGSVDSLAGDISINLDNRGKVTNLSGKIIIKGFNYSGVISNGDILIDGKNLGGVMLVGGGEVILNSDKLIIQRETLSRSSGVKSRTSINISNVFSSGNRTVVNGKVYSNLGGGSVSIINGDVFVNGKKLDPDGSSEKSNINGLNKITLNSELEIDYIDHTVKFKGNDTGFNGNRLQVGEFMLRADDKDPERIFLLFREQVILIRKDDIRIANQSYFKNMGDDFSFGDQENSLGNLKLLK